MIYNQSKLAVILSLMATGALANPVPQTKPGDDTKTEHQLVLVTCHLPADQGPCDGAFPRWHYNCSIGFCETFSYGGCEGNENNYRNREDCEYSCFGACPKSPHHESQHHESKHHSPGGSGMGLIERLIMSIFARGAAESESIRQPGSMFGEGGPNSGHSTPEINLARPKEPSGTSTAHDTHIIGSQGIRPSGSGGSSTVTNTKQPSSKTVTSRSSNPEHEILTSKASVSSTSSQTSHSSSGDHHDSHTSLSSRPSSASSTSKSSSSSHSSSSDHSSHPSSSSSSSSKNSSTSSSKPSSSSSSSRKTSSTSSSHPSSSSSSSRKTSSTSSSHPSSSSSSSRKTSSTSSSHPSSSSSSSRKSSSTSSSHSSSGSSSRKIG